MPLSKGRTYIGSDSGKKTGEGNVCTCSTGNNGRMAKII
jgi:hypothetical protein